MPVNIELKVKVDNLAEVERAVRKLTGLPGVRFHQEDTFFHVRHGRLKLRKNSDGRGELIQYCRADTAAAKRSDYLLTPVTDPDGLVALLEAALGVQGVVRKERTVYLVGNTRVHLDRVDELGTFVELEVVLQDGQTEAEGRSVAAGLMTLLGLDGAGLVGVAYGDLLAR